MPDGDGFFLSWLAPRVAAAAAAPATAPVHRALRTACPPAGIAFVFDDADDGFVLGLPGPSLERVGHGRWAEALDALGDADAPPGLMLFLADRVAWHGLLTTGGRDKEAVFATALEVGIFRAVGPGGQWACEPGGR